MRLGVIGGSLLAVASVVLVSGCASGLQGPGAGASPDSVSVEAAVSGPELWGTVALWISPERQVSMCPVPFIDIGFGYPEVCDDPLAVAGLDADDVPPASASTVPAAGSGWTWGPHVVTGYLDADANRFTVTGIDTPEATALEKAQWAPPANPTPQPTYATDEEKLAASYAEHDPDRYGCVEPEGGWRDAGDVEGLIGPYSAAYPEQVVGWSALGVSEGVQIVLIGAAPGADLEAVRAGMQTLFPDAACILTSQISAEQLRNALAEPLFGPDPYLAHGGTDAGGLTVVDPYLWISRTAPSDELDAAIARYPAGFVQLRTWFQRLP